MRLLDLISQARYAAVHTNDGTGLPCAEPFQRIVCDCPMRYVLSDELTICATQLAYAEGDRLSGCLDLIHAPGRRVWVEWPDVPRQQALNELPGLKQKWGPTARHAGALVCASADCRSGTIRTFWSANDELAFLSPIITTFDLDGCPAPTPDAVPEWDTFVQTNSEPALNELLSHLRFRFDSRWSRYYASRCATAASRAEILRRNLATCAFDGPMLMAFFLLLGARTLLPRREVSHERLNRARRRLGKPALLEHIEVHAPLQAMAPSNGTPETGPTRASPRLHHVRGHIVRRGPTVFWRSPHLRGSTRRGQIRSRTVLMSFAEGAAA